MVVGKTVLTATPLFTLSDMWEAVTEFKDHPLCLFLSGTGPIQSAGSFDGPEPGPEKKAAGKLRLAWRGA